jgi:hypothetical protein
MKGLAMPGSANADAAVRLLTARAHDRSTELEASGDDIWQVGCSW